MGTHGTQIGPKGDPESPRGPKREVQDHSGAPFSSISESISMLSKDPKRYSEGGCEASWFLFLGYLFYVFPYITASPVPIIAFQMPCLKLQTRFQYFPLQLASYNIRRLSYPYAKTPWVRLVRGRAEDGYIYG